MSSGFERFDFSHEWLKRVVGFLIGFVFAIANTPCNFLYLNQRIYDKIKKKEKWKKRKKNPHPLLSPLHL